MKIVKQGAIQQPPWVGQWQCPVCKTVIELNAADDAAAKPHYVPDYFLGGGRENTEAVYVRCPVCQERRFFVSPGTEATG